MLTREQPKEQQCSISLMTELDNSAKHTPAANRVLGSTDNVRLHIVV